MKKRGNKSKRGAVRKIHINLPEEVHVKLRVKCALEDVTIQEWVAGLIEQELKGLTLLPEQKRKRTRNG